MTTGNKKAAYYYHHPEYRYNCAQAIVHQWTGDRDMVSEMRMFGGGRADNGICGALHGALVVAEAKGIEKGLVSSRFVEIAGTPYCREIRSMGKVSCEKCVELADEVLTSTIKEL